MPDNPFKYELLKQNGKSAVDEEVSRLHQIVAAEQRRFRRLVFWTIAVWAVWILMISLSLVVPMVQAHINGPPPHPTTMPVAPPAAPHPAAGGHAWLGMILGVLIVGAFLGLPVAGVVLAILLVVTRRTVSMNHLRASLAAIEAQLRMLGAARSAGSGGAQGDSP